MKKLLLALIFLSLNSYALTFEIVGPCKETPLAQGEIEIENLYDTSIGHITLEIFKKFNVPYHGSETGMSSIFNTPMGLDAMEILSDTDMRAHGWCYQIDGEIPEALAVEVFPEENEAKNHHLKWFFGYSTYKSGEWYGYCDPTFEIAPEQFCK